MLVEFVKNKKRHRIGCVVALDRDKIGWSQCNIKLDKFDKQLGVDIAVGRATIGSNKRIPQSSLATYNHMLYRAKAYFKIGNDKPSASPHFFQSISD